MSNITRIEADGNIYFRRAWTGGDTPTLSFPDDRESRALLMAFFTEQLEHIKYHPIPNSGQLDILFNRARLDAWRTLFP